LLEERGKKPSRHIVQMAIAACLGENKTTAQIAAKKDVQLPIPRDYQEAGFSILGHRKIIATGGGGKSDGVLKKGDRWRLCDPG